MGKRVKIFRGIGMARICHRNSYAPLHIRGHYTKFAHTSSNDWSCTISVYRHHRILHKVVIFSQNIVDFISFVCILHLIFHVLVWFSPIMHTKNAGYTTCVYSTYVNKNVCIELSVYNVLTPTTRIVNQPKALRTLSRRDTMWRGLPLPSTPCIKKIVPVEWIPSTLNQRDATHTYMIKIMHRQLVI